MNVGDAVWWWGDEEDVEGRVKHHGHILLIDEFVAIVGFRAGKEDLWTMQCWTRPLDQVHLEES